MTRYFSPVQPKAILLRTARHSIRFANSSRTETKFKAILFSCAYIKAQLQAHSGTKCKFCLVGSAISGARYLGAFFRFLLSSFAFTDSRAVLGRVWGLHALRRPPSHPLSLLTFTDSRVVLGRAWGLSAFAHRPQPLFCY